MKKQVFTTWEDANGKWSKDLIGGKAAGLFKMWSDGFKVPPAMVITTEVCNHYLTPKKGFSMESLMVEVMATVEDMKNSVGNGIAPLLSVRSGSRVSMPGMMDTILNVGIIPSTWTYWKEKLGARTAYDCYRRYLQMHGEVVLEISPEKFEGALSEIKAKYKCKLDCDLPAEAMELLVKAFENIYTHEGVTVPDTVERQLSMAIEGVFNSWNSPRAKSYRKMNGYSDSWGTAVTIQQMVFGNMNDKSGSGVLFTRNPSNGDNEIVGEFLINAQGEDVVAGIRTPQPLIDMKTWDPKNFDLLIPLVESMEEKYRDMQDVEFTIEDGVLYILQTRSGKRSAQAAFKVAHDMLEDGYITKEEAFERVSAKMLSVLTKPKLDPKCKTSPLVTGIAGGGAVVSGKMMLSSEAAKKCMSPCILVRKETTPEDIEGINAAIGVLTGTGGQTCHAAVVARGMNKTCVVGCTSLKFEGAKVEFIPGLKVTEGELISIDGETGNVWFGTVPVIQGKLSEEAKTLINMALEEKPLLVGTSSDDAVDGRIYLETHEYDTTPEALVAHACELLDAGLTVIIDLHTRQDVLTDGDAMVEFIAQAPPKKELMVAQKVYALVKGIEDEALKRIQVVVPEYLSGADMKGLSVIPAVDSLKSLMSTNGYCIPSKALMTEVFGGADTFNEFLDLMAKGGKEAKVLPVAVTKMQFLYNKLGKGA